MNKKTQKTILYSAAGLASCAFVFSTALFLTYLQASNSDPHIVLPDVLVNDIDQIKLGDVVDCVVEFRLPWGHTPEKVSLTLPEGLQAVADPKVEKIKTTWGRTRWRITGLVQPYRTGDIPDGRLDVSFYSSKRDSITSSASCALPAIKVHVVDTENRRELDLASEVIPDRDGNGRKMLAIVAAMAALAILAAILLFLMKRRRTIAETVAVPPWDEALAGLRALRLSLQEGKINCMQCFSSLSDVLRRYLEKRFMLPATAQTTDEFLIDLDKGGSPLEDRYRVFLREFLTASDLIKFARFPADGNLVGNALCRAEDLVLSTTPKHPSNSNTGASV